MIINRDFWPKYNLFVNGGYHRLIDSGSKRERQPLKCTKQSVIPEFVVSFVSFD